MEAEDGYTALTFRGDPQACSVFLGIILGLAWVCLIIIEI